MNVRLSRYLFVTGAIIIRLATNAQSVSFEETVSAPLFSIEGMARAGQVAVDQGASVFASNALIGQLGDADILLLRVNGTGAIVQDLTIGDDGGQGYHDVAKELVQANKHYYLTGYTRAIDTAAAHTFTAFLIEVDTALNFTWQKNYILPDKEIYGEAMTTVNGQELLIAGKIYDNGEFQSFLMHTDSAGTPLWIKQYAMPHGETIQCVRRLPGGDILLSGSMVFGFELVLPFVCKVNAQGDFLWGRYYNYPPGFVERSSFLFMHVASVDHIQLAGYTDKFGSGSTDNYVVDIDSSGAVNWARTYGGSQFDEPNMVQYDNLSGEIVMVGSSGSFAELGVPYPIAVRVSTEGDLIGAALYGDTSVYQPARFYHSCRVNPSRRLLMGSRDFPADDLYIVGTDDDLANTCEFHPVTATAMSQSTGTSAFTAVVTQPVPLVNSIALGHSHYGQLNVLCDQPTGTPPPIALPNTLTIYPVPGNGSFVFAAPTGFRPTLLEVMDMQGRCVWSTATITGEHLNIAASIASGNYILRFTDAAGARLSAKYRKD